MALYIILVVIKVKKTDIVFFMNLKVRVQIILIRNLIFKVMRTFT